MAAIFFNEKFCILIKSSLKFVPKGPIDNNSIGCGNGLAPRIGDKSLPEPILTWFTGAYMRHLGEFNGGSAKRPLELGRRWANYTPAFSCEYIYLSIP